MVRSMSSPALSLSFTTASFLLGLISILIGRRVHYLDHLPVFNAIAATMLALVVVGLAAPVVPLWRSRGRGASLWIAAALALVVVATYLLDD